MSLPSQSVPVTRRWRLLRPIRLSTFLLLVLAIALMVSLALQRVRERQLRDTIAVYRRPRTEAILDTLARPMPLHYQDGAPLDEVFKELKRTTTGSPGLVSGMPIYVDPIGLQKAQRNLKAEVRRPASADSLPLFEHLRRVLDPLGLGYTVRDGYLEISSKESLNDVPDPYLYYRDVLR